jgi:hypothetical protein
MSRRSTPERLDEARHAATQHRLILDGVTEASADSWIEAWEAQAARDGLQRGAAYWDAAWAWIARGKGPTANAVSRGAPRLARVGCQRQGRDSGE